MHAWHGIPPTDLCPTHLAREWNELRQVCAVGRNQWDFDGEWHYQKLRGHISEGQLLPAYLQERFEALATELARRGRRVPVVPTVPEWIANLDHERLRPTDAREYNEAVLSSKCAAFQTRQQTQQNLGRHRRVA